MEQIQCSLHYPGRGFKTEAVRLVSIDMSEWEDTRQQVASTYEVRLLTGLLSQQFPYAIARTELPALQQECSKLIETGDISIISAILTLSGFIDQAIEQREAGVLFEVWPGEYFENQTCLLPGTDILSDLIEINDLAIDRDI